MKKPIPILVLWAGVVGALAQTVDFNNTRTFATTADRAVYEAGGTRLVGTQFAAQLAYGTSASSLTPHTLVTTFRNVPRTDPLAGTWVGRTLTLEGMSAGQTAILQVRAWDSTGGVTFNQALLRSTSQTFTYLIPQPGSPPSAFYIENFRSFTVNVPEPSVIGLALLGVFAIFMLKRHRSS